jgi:hypothetical protein
VSTSTFTAAYAVMKQSWSDTVRRWDDGRRGKTENARQLTADTVFNAQEFYEQNRGTHCMSSISVPQQSWLGGPVDEVSVSSFKRQAFDSYRQDPVKVTISSVMHSITTRINTNIWASTYSPRFRQSS